jgi:hypothetical protein
MLMRSGFLGAILAITLAVPVEGQEPEVQEHDVQLERLPRPEAQTAAAEKIADALAREEAQIQHDAADCHASNPEAGIEYHVTAKRLLETPAIYSIEIAKEWYCGGAYPASDVYALTFDLHSGARYDLGHAFHIETAESKAAIVVKYLPEGCDELDEDSVAETLRQSRVSLGVTDEELIFYFSEIPHVAQACFQPAHVPLTELSYVANQNELQRLGPPFTSH